MLRATGVESERRCGTRDRKPSPSPSNGRHGRDGRDPTPSVTIRPATFGPPLERGESERGRESGAATRSQFARVSPPLKSAERVSVDESDRGTTLIGRDLVSEESCPSLACRLARRDVVEG